MFELADFLLQAYAKMTKTLVLEPAPRMLGQLPKTRHDFFERGPLPHQQTTALLDDDHNHPQLLNALPRAFVGEPRLRTFATR